MPKGDGYFDGWTEVDGKILVSPTLFDHPIPLATLSEARYTISTDMKWAQRRCSSAERIHRSSVVPPALSEPA